MPISKKLLAISFTIAMLLNGAFLVYYLSTNKNTESNSSNEVLSQNIEPSLVPQPVPEGAVVFSLANSQARYVVTQSTLGGEKKQISGSTSAVSGEGWINFDSQEVYLMAFIDLSELDSQNKTRDGHINELFKSTDAYITFTTDDLQDKITEGEFSTTVNADLTINQVTKKVPFQVVGTISKAQFTASGSAQIKMSEFGIEPPSLVNVNSTEDEMTLEFEVEGINAE